jgi:nicotinate phosphoribosyltransferase
METQFQPEETEFIIKSFLDLDHYKLTMGQFAFHRYPNVPVKYASTNRTKSVRLAEIIEEEDYRRELDHVQDLKPTPEELAYLRTLKNNGEALFKDDYLDFLANIKIPGYKLTKEDGQFKTEFPGPWSKAIYWETLDLSIKNELYYRALMKNLSPEQRQAVYQEGVKRLEGKINLFNENPLVRFIEFGTRRRFSQAWQEYVVRKMKQGLEHNQMIGTSNVNLARTYGLAPKGTMAHETFMIMSGIMHSSDEEIRASHNQVLREWWDEYGVDLSIALTDTYGSEFFFKDMTLEQARNWKGLRQDSGNPRSFANQQLGFYERFEIDPKTKLFVPSDGLDEKKIVGLTNEFTKRIPTVAGYGTNATNDLGLKSLSLVVKAVESCGHGTVKLTDNPAKGMGEQEDVQRFRRIFEYDPRKYTLEECRY